jgi:hypothetical protein
MRSDSNIYIGAGRVDAIPFRNPTFPISNMSFVPDSTHHDDDHPNILALKNSGISKLSPYSGIILTVVLAVLALLRLYVFETLLPRLYRRTWPSLIDDTQRRNFINHHVAAMLKLTMVASQVYPIIGLIFGDLTLQSPISKGSSVTLGDIMVVGVQIFVGMYVFELLYRSRVSYISVLHHIGAIVIAESAVAIGIDFTHQKSATAQFLICFVWGELCAVCICFEADGQGLFDVVAEFWPHIALILYRVYPERHYFLAWVFRSTVICELLGTTVESVLVLWIFVTLWERWNLAFKVVTPSLHLLFTIAQLWGAWVFWIIAKKEARACQEEMMAQREEQSMAGMTGVDDKAHSVEDQVVL